MPLLAPRSDGCNRASQPSRGYVGSAADNRLIVLRKAASPLNSQGSTPPGLEAPADRKSRPMSDGHGRLEDWRADFRLRWVFHGFRGGPQSGCHDHVSRPRHSERSVRVARTTRTGSLRAMVYGTYATEVTFRKSRRNR